MKRCPNCHFALDNSATLCPRCGASVPVVWPPSPADVPASGPPLRFLTGRRGSDIVLGIGLGLSLPLLTRDLPFPALHGGIILPAFCILAAELALYSWSSRRYPTFARSLGFTSLVTFALALGAFGLYFYVISGSH